MARSPVSEGDRPTPVCPTSIKALLTLGKPSGPGPGALIPGFPCWEGPRAGPAGSAAKKAKFRKAQETSLHCLARVSSPWREREGPDPYPQPLPLRGRVWGVFQGHPSCRKCGKFCFPTRFRVVLKIKATRAGGGNPELAGTVPCSCLLETWKLHVMRQAFSRSPGGGVLKTCWVRCLLQVPKGWPSQAGEPGCPP